MKVRYEGVRSTERYLTVYLRVDVGASIQFQAVRVPMEDLTTVEFTQELDNAARRKLIEIWSEVDLADPLF